MKVCERWERWREMPSYRVIVRHIYIYIYIYIYISIYIHIVGSDEIYGKVPDYQPPPNTDPLSYLSNYKIYQKIIYTRTVSNLMINIISICFLKYLILQLLFDQM